MQKLEVLQKGFKNMEQNIENIQAHSSPLGVLIKKLGIILSVFVFLLPVFFVPVFSVNLYVAKITLLATGLVAVFAVFLSSVLSSGLIEIPKAKYLLPMILLAAVALVSSALSGSIGLSVAGSVFDLGSSGSILMLVFSLLMAMMAAKNIGAVNKVITAFFYSTTVLAVYTLLGSFGASLLPISAASKMPRLLVGGAVDTSIIFGVTVILILCALNMSELSKKMRYLLMFLLIFSIIFVGAASFMPNIIMLAVIAMIFFAYILSWSFGHFSEQQDNESRHKKISLSSLLVLIAMIVLILGGAGIGNYISGLLKVQSAEIRPNFQTSMDLAMSAWKQNFALGVGPNRFAQFWSIHKPIEINQTQFWNSDFFTASGFVPTLAITTGLLGLLSLIAFVVMYLLTGVKAIFAQANANRSRYLATATFLASFYLWVMLFLYTPGIVILVLTFIFTGLFTATLVPQGIVGLWKINIFSNPKTNFLSVLATMVLLILSVAGGYFVWERSVAAVTFQKGVIEYQTSGNADLAKEYITKSINIVPTDSYWRGLAEISVSELGKVLGGVSNVNQITEATRNQVQVLISNSVAAAKKAVELDNRNFTNWFALARVYEILASNSIQGSLENARNSYNEAALRSPQNPSVPLALARLDAMDGKIDDARTNIMKALELKKNYTDAYFTLAQLEVAANNIPAAIRSVEATTIIEPGNAGLFFQLGLLKYNQKDFVGSASALEKSIVLAPNYANAEYFLGLSYYQLGKKSEALKQFEEIQKTNPDNQEVQFIISNLIAGKPLFSDAKPPIDNKPEKRAELPVAE